MTQPGPKSHTSHKKWTNEENNAIVTVFPKEICGKCPVTSVSLKVAYECFKCLHGWVDPQAWSKINDILRKGDK